MLISLSEYAALHGRDPSTIRQRVLRGLSPSAVKIGRNWCIDSEEPLEDTRIKSGKYIGWRKPSTGEGQVDT